MARLGLAEDQRDRRNLRQYVGDERGRVADRRGGRSYDNREDHEPKSRTSWWLKTMAIVGSVLVVISGGALIALYGLSSLYENKVGREDILADVPTVESRSDEPMNFLVLGSDSREGEAKQDLEETGSRSDTIMIVHVNADKTGAFIVSIPRDSFVDIPAGGDWRGGKNKINAALSFGGANLAAKTIYNLTRVPLNGAMLVNFDGVQRMVEAVGGVEVCTPFDVPALSGRLWKAGCHQMTPADAEEFVRQRYFVPGGDLGRIKNQQNVIKGLMKKATSTGVLTNPGKLDNLITAMAESLTVDKDMNLRNLVFELKGISPDNIRFATAPILGTETIDGVGSTVKLDMAGTEELFQAVLADKTDEWLTAHPQPDVASIPGS